MGDLEFSKQQTQLDIGITLSSGGITCCSTNNMCNLSPTKAMKL